jgi:hypothetical protein
MMVAQNKITYAELERLKKVLPVGKMGRPTATAAWFTDGRINEPEPQETGNVTPPNADFSHTPPKAQ